MFQSWNVQLIVIIVTTRKIYIYLFVYLFIYFSIKNIYLLRILYEQTLGTLYFKVSLLHM